MKLEKGTPNEMHDIRKIYSFYSSRPRITKLDFLISLCFQIYQRSKLTKYIKYEMGSIGLNKILFGIVFKDGFKPYM